MRKANKLPAQPITIPNGRKSTDKKKKGDKCVKLPADNKSVTRLQQDPIGITKFLVPKSQEQRDYELLGREMVQLRKRVLTLEATVLVSQGLEVRVNEIEKFLDAESVGYGEDSEATGGDSDYDESGFIDQDEITQEESDDDELEIISDSDEMADDDSDEDVELMPVAKKRKVTPDSASTDPAVAPTPVVHKIGE